MTERLDALHAHLVLLDVVTEAYKDDEKLIEIVYEVRTKYEKNIL